MHIVLTTIKPDSAKTLASSLIDERVAACVNILPGVTSVYRWQGQVQSDDETLLVIKTSAESLPRLMERVAALHPYDVPEIVALRAADVSDSYAAWVNACTSGENNE